MGSLCGNETFGAPSRQWQGERPEFSCLQTLVLTSAPRLAVWTVALIYFPWLVRRRTVRIETKNWLYWAKQVLGSMMLVLSVVTVLTVLNHLNGTRGDSTSLAQLFVSCAGTATMLLVLALVFLERQKGVTTSIVLFLFWLTTVIADLVPFYNFILRQDSGGHFVRAAVFYMTFTLQLFQLGLHSVSQTSCSEYPQNDSPETAASFPAWLTYCWISRLMSRGYKDELREEDVFRLNPRDRMLENGKEFLKNRIFRRTTTSLSAER